MNWLKTTSQYLLGQLAAIMPLVRSTSDTPVELSAEVDANGRGIQRVVDAAPWAYDSTNDLTKTSVVRREPLIVQTHNATNVAVNNYNIGPVVDCRPYDSICVSLKSDASHARKLEILWYMDSGGANLLGTDMIIGAASSDFGTARGQVKSSYARIKVYNDDGTSSHTMSTWTTLIP